MLCYKDKTFCPYYEDCKTGATCDRAFLPSVKEDAIAWWGNENAPVCVYAEYPKCFEARIN